MAHRFLRWDRDQPFLLPLDLRDWLPTDHLAWFILDVVGHSPFYLLAVLIPNELILRCRFEPGDCTARIADDPRYGLRSAGLRQCGCLLVQVLDDPGHKQSQSAQDYKRPKPPHDRTVYLGLLGVFKKIANWQRTSHVGLARGAERRREHDRPAVRRDELHPRVVGDILDPCLLFCAHHRASGLATALEQSQRREQYHQQEDDAICGKDHALGVPVEQRPPPGHQKDASYEQKANQGLTGTPPRRPSHPQLPPGHLAPSFTQLVVVTPWPIVSCGPLAHKPHFTHGSQMVSSGGVGQSGVSFPLFRCLFTLSSNEPYSARAADAL